MPEKFLIAPYEVGLQRNMKPWMIPDKSFSELNNAYIYRGYVRKRFGSTGIGGTFGLTPELSRLRVKVDTTDGSGNTTPAITTPIAGDIGQMFSIGDEYFTVVIANGDMLSTSATATTYTFNTATGAFVIQGSLAATDVYWYPTLPVMGFSNYESALINSEPTYAFDTRFAYKIVNNAWEREDGETVPGDALWSGTDADFFWTMTYRGSTPDDNILFVTNYVRADQMRYFDGTNWTSYAPDFIAGGTDTIESCRCILRFKDRLLLFNTLEQVGGVNTKVFPQRVRFSHVGSPFSATAFIEAPNGTGGGLKDADTDEQIINATIYKDRVIVFFERSTRELVYTGNSADPFIWRDINTDRGVESTFSVINFDQSLLGVGQTGIYACNGYNIERIDVAIPDEVFEFHNDDDGPTRVHGIYDYQAEMVYWSVPEKTGASKYPKQVLAYNFANNTWATFDDSITAFGYYYNDDDRTWADMDLTWEQYDTSWNSYFIEQDYMVPIAGNQQGFTFIISPDITSNAFSLQITNMTIASGLVTFTVINHNLQSGDWIFIANCQGITELNEKILKVNVLTANTFTVDEQPAVTGTYTGGGSILLVSKVDIKTKRFNFYTQQGQNTSITQLDCFVDRVDDSEITIDFLPSSTNISLRDDAIATGTLLGTSVLDLSAYVLVPLEAYQERFWHAVYGYSTGENIQIRMYWTDTQMKDGSISLSGFGLHAMMIYAGRSGMI